MKPVEPGIASTTPAVIYKGDEARGVRRKARIAITPPSGFHGLELVFGVLTCGLGGSPLVRVGYFNYPTSPVANLAPDCETTRNPPCYAAVLVSP
jgi:hypothetical protein